MQQRAKNKTNNHIHITSLSSLRITLKSLLGMMFYWTLMAGVMLCQQLPTTSANYKDDACETKSKPGLCKEWSECTVMKTLIERGEYTNRDVVSCGSGVREELICCPVEMTDTNIELTTAKTVKTFHMCNFRSSPGLVPTTNSTDRPAVRACERIRKGWYTGLSQQILGGTQPELGELPHVVDIVYNRSGYANEVHCGGSLIDTRFVLTVAHCVSLSDSGPAVARMGVVNLKDPNVVEIKIKEIFIHDDYSRRSSYNDIAILELERPAPLNEFIQPVCLYIDEADPKTEEKLLVTGWGILNARTRAFSDILMKTPVHVISLERCNASYVDVLSRKLHEGIKQTQLCVEDNASQGISGDPLNLVVDESSKNYRLLGMVSHGMIDVSPLPTIYTRVAAFLDFIERICWPTGGD